MKRRRVLTSADITQSSVLQQRTSGWGPYSQYGTRMAQNKAIIRLPPTESSFITELGGTGVSDGISVGSQGPSVSFESSSGLGGCQRLIEDGFFDNNSYYTFTEENNFVQLLLYDFYKNSSTTIALQPRTCFIDMGGALKLALSKKGGSAGEQIQRLQQEITFSLLASFGITWPRFCWWNLDTIYPGSPWKKSVDNQFYYPQANPTDDYFDGTSDVGAMFIQSADSVPLILVQLIGVSQLTFSINPAFQAANPDHDFYLQLMTPRLDPIFTNGTYPASLYLNQNLINGQNGWFEKGPYVFGFGFWDASTSQFHDIYDTDTSPIATTPLEFIYNDFLSTTVLTFFTEEDRITITNNNCEARKLQKIVIANFPFTLVNSRYNFIRSPELSSNQVIPFLSSTDAGAPGDTIGILWNDLTNGNLSRDISGHHGVNVISTTAKEINPMFNQSLYTLFIETEWADVIGSSMQSSSNFIIQGEDSRSRALKDNTVFFSNRIPSIWKLLPITLDPTLESFPTLYDGYCPAWKTTSDSSSNYDTQLDIQKFCRNRLLWNYLTTQASPPLPTSAPDLTYPTKSPNYDAIQQRWSSSFLTTGTLKPSEKSVHFMRAIGF